LIAIHHTGTHNDYVKVKEGPTPEVVDIIIPTVDTVRCTYLMDLLVKHEKPCLFVGPTGTGKSIYIQVCESMVHLKGGSAQEKIAMDKGWN